MNKILFTLLLALSIVFQSCKDDEKLPQTLNANEANEILNNMAGQMSNDMQSIMASEGLQKTNSALQFLETDVFSLADFQAIKENPENPGLALSQKISTQFSGLLNNKANARSTENTEFEEYWGIYTYDLSTDTFIYDNNEAAVNYVQFNFPVEGSSTNNASFTITEFASYTYVDGNSEDIGHFTSIENLAASLSIDEEIISSIDLDMDYINDQVIGIDLELFMKPFSLSITSKASNKSFTNTLDFSNQTETILSYELTANFTEQLNNVNTSLISLNGFIQYRALKIDGTVNVQNIMESEENLSNAILNENIDLTLYSNNNKLGILVFEFSTEGDLLVYIEFNDKTRKLLTDYFQDFGQMIG